jgi:hypothetical protein
MLHETPEGTHRRLLPIMAQSRFAVRPGMEAFQPLDGVPAAEALACARDADRWHQLVPVRYEGAVGGFTIFRVHFDPALDATGFVGWLHSHLARTTGIRHIVICGRPASRPTALTMSGAASSMTGGVRPTGRSLSCRPSAA